MIFSRSRSFDLSKLTMQKWISGKADLNKSLHNYEVRTASSPEAVKAGYAIYANDRWLDLRQEKQGLIANFLKQTSKKKDCTLWLMEL
ncbi:MAG TPA: hypothetical protein V6C86_23470 [Oculatellaceae cyanobacterium]